MSDYFILNAEFTPEYCSIIKCPPSLDDQTWRIADGERMGEHYPPKIRFDMSKEHDGIVVPDFIHNTLHLPMVSGQLKALLEKESGAEIEFLPFTLYNHRGRVAAEGCHIANLLGSLDCVDRRRTEGDESFITPGTYSGLFRLYLSAEQLPPTAKLFRLASMPSVIIIREDLRALLEQQGISGVEYIAMGEECMLF
jgi:hypothetical protein